MGRTFGKSGYVLSPALIRVLSCDNASGPASWEAVVVSKAACDKTQVDVQAVVAWGSDRAAP